MGNAVVKRVVHRVHIRAGRPAAGGHAAVNRGQKGLAQKRAKRRAELVALGVNQRLRVAVVRAVGGVGVNHHIGAPVAEKAVESLRGKAVGFDEIAVQVKVAAIAAKAE